MKQIKNLLMLAGFALAITFAFAFRPAEKVMKTDNVYYEYSGPNTTQTELEDPDNWSAPQQSDPDDCNGGSSLPCVVSSPFTDKNDFIQDIKDNGLTATIEHYRHL